MFVRPQTMSSEAQTDSDYKCNSCIHQASKTYKTQATVTADIQFTSIMKYDHCYVKPPSVQQNYALAGFESVSEEDITVTIENNELPFQPSSLVTDNTHADNITTPEELLVQCEAASDQCDIIEEETITIGGAQPIKPRDVTQTQSATVAGENAIDEQDGDDADNKPKTDWTIQQCITAMSQLLLLFRVCRQPGCGEDTQLPITVRKRGFSIFVETRCPQGHRCTWDSQPFIGNIPCANLQIPSAVFITGNSYAAFLDVCKVANIQALQERQYYNLQAAYMIPQVELAWQKHNDAVLAAIGDSALTVAGDARHDSPGHCATFGTYTLLDTSTNLILSQETVKSTEVNNSYWLEIEGLDRCLSHMDAHGNKVAILTTDRHGGIRKLMREQYGSIVHEYDLWHIIKGVKKKLSKTGDKMLMQWLQAIVNHLWFCAATCRGSAAMLKTKWLSILYHVRNQHEWGLALGDELTRCDHAPYSVEQARSRTWLKADSPAYKKLQDAVTSKNLLADLERVDTFICISIIKKHLSQLLALKY